MKDSTICELCSEPIKKDEERSVWKEVVGAGYIVYGAGYYHIWCWLEEMCCHANLINMHEGIEGL